MNIDHETPIGKAVDTTVDHDAPPEVQGHRFRFRHHEEAKDAVLAETSNEESDVEGHRSFAARMHDVPEADDEDQAPEVEGYRMRLR